MGAPKKFLADNGGELANAEYRDMCENLSIEFTNTAAYSPWQNGLCERNHAVVDDCISNMLEQNRDMKLDAALVWAIHAKNALQMVYGFSPYQLVFGANPNLPSTMIDKPLPFNGNTICETFAEHLEALHAGRKAFIEAESSAKILKALCHQIRNVGGQFETREQDLLQKRRWKKMEGGWESDRTGWENCFHPLWQCLSQSSSISYYSSRGRIH